MDEIIKNATDDIDRGEIKQFMQEYVGEDFFNKIENEIMKAFQNTEKINIFKCNVLIQDIPIANRDINKFFSLRTLSEEDIIDTMIELTIDRLNKRPELNRYIIKSCYMSGFEGLDDILRPEVRFTKKACKKFFPCCCIIPFLSCIPKVFFGEMQNKYELRHLDVLITFITI